MVILAFLYSRTPSALPSPLPYVILSDYVPENQTDLP